MINRLQRILTVFIIFTFFAACGGNIEYKQITINKMLRRPLEYSGTPVRVKVKTITIQAPLFDFFAKDIRPIRTSPPVPIAVKYSGELPLDDSSIEMFGKMILVGTDYIFFADSINYIE